MHSSVDHQTAVAGPTRQSQKSKRIKTRLILIDSCWFLRTSDGPFVALADLLNVVASLFIRRHFVSKLRHRAFASVVTRKHEVHAVIEAIQQLTKIARATGNILRGIVRPSHAETRA